MSSDVVIRAEGLRENYLVGHHTPRGVGRLLPFQRTGRQSRMYHLKLVREADSRRQDCHARASAARASIWL